MDKLEYVSCHEIHELEPSTSLLLTGGETFEEIRPRSFQIQDGT